MDIPLPMSMVLLSLLSLLSSSPNGVLPVLASDLLTEEEDTKRRLDGLTKDRERA